MCIVFLLMKTRKSQLILILAVLGLTVYNILPTIFYYTKPLSESVSAIQAEETAQQIAGRVSRMEQDSIEWLSSYCKLVGVNPLSISSRGPNLLSLRCAKLEEIALLKQFLPRAAALVSFGPSQLMPLVSPNDPKELLIERKVGPSLDGLFEFVPKGSAKYHTLVQERAAAIRACLASPSPVQTQILSLDKDMSKTVREETLLSIAASISEIAEIHAKDPKFAKRIAGRYTPAKGIQSFLDASASLRDELKRDNFFERKQLQLAAAEKFIKTHKALFTATERNPIFNDVTVDLERERLVLKLHSDLAGVKDPVIEQRVWAEIAYISRETNEEIVRAADGLVIALHELPQTTGILCLKLDALADRQVEVVKQTLQTLWHPKHPDLKDLPIVSSEEYGLLSAAQKPICVVVSAERGALRVAVHGLERIARGYEGSTESASAQTLKSDAAALGELLWQHGFGKVSETLFEHPNFFAPVLTATRETFHTYGDRKSAWLELSTYGQRLFALNQIETKQHDELLKWEDEYRTAQVSMDPAIRFQVPKPTRSPFWNNVVLSVRKMVRGDERKILRWGLDLSGGKTVQIELRDKENHLVSDEHAIKQGINELFERVNKMGVSDVSIRQVGSHIALDFPGSQPLSAQELISASSMTFHVVNERFTSVTAQRFLQEVWNEAVAYRQTDPESIQKIAYRQLHVGPQTESARYLLQDGLKLAPPDSTSSQTKFDDAFSKVVLVRNAKENPLLIVFSAHALEGIDLDNIHANYDPSKGNYLSFEVKKGSQDRLFAWTSRFSKERIAGTSYDLGGGHGWRMAVLLNGTTISAPSLESPLKDSASISGHFSMREVTQLVNDLKAGSLSFTPKILSEKNVSPELGQHDRLQGIAATLAALVLVVGAMVLYYRFAGVVASIAVLFNLLILWAVLQNLGASLSLAGLAGVILTVGMAVDANVLVFERMKEEFAISGRLASAIQAGYKKAFSAIVDSNITTIIAALILLNFDAGPIKAFAVSMIIGIGSSMFTALFMTRFYFEGWVQNGKHTKLSMAHWFGRTRWDVLKRAKGAFACAVVVIVAGTGCLFMQRGHLFGMDFTGGYALSLELDGSRTKNPAGDVGKALLAAGLGSSDFHIREHDPKTHLQVFFKQNVPNATPEWIVGAIRNAGLELTPTSAKNLGEHWTAMSGQLSESMRNHALLGLGLAFVAIFIYIAIRFESKYALAATGCLLHDVLITLGCMGLLALCGVPIQIDLNTIAALMTIIGYSLNDTIIIFDRIREDAQLFPHKPLNEIVNRSVNSTLSRTVITSGTTLLVVLALLLFGGASVFNFALVMTIGIVFGTLSSWFIACPLMLFFHRKETHVESLS